MTEAPHHTPHGDAARAVLHAPMGAEEETNR